MRRCIIVTDLGRLVAYRITQAEGELSPSFTDLHEESFDKSHSHTSDRVTDQAGQFPSGAAGMSHGERHNEAAEALSVQIARVAETVNAVAAKEPETAIYFAAPKTIHRQVLDQLKPAVVERITKDLALDLTKHPKLDLLKRFENS